MGNCAISGNWWWAWWDWNSYCEKFTKQLWTQDVVSLTEQVGDAGILFDPNDVFDMAKKISILLKDETLRNEKKALGFEMVSNFNHKEYKDKLMDVLNQS